MPRVNLTKEDRQLNKIYNFILGTCYTQRIPQRVLADELGISQQAYAYKIKHRSFSLSDFVTIMNFLGKDVTECID